MFEDVTVWDVVGLIGALTICSAYFSVSRGWLNPRGLPYQMMNLAGSVLLLISLWFKPNPGAILIEVLWAAIALSSIYGILAGRRQN